MILASVRSIGVLSSTKIRNSRIIFSGAVKFSGGRFMSPAGQLRLATRRKGVDAAFIDSEPPSGA